MDGWIQETNKVRSPIYSNKILKIEEINANLWSWDQARGIQLHGTWIIYFYISAKPIQSIFSVGHHMNPVKELSFCIPMS